MGLVLASMVVAAALVGLHEPGSIEGHEAASIDYTIVRGITLSTHRSGEDWGSDAAAATLGDLREVGANWVAIHPYARIGAEGEVQFWPIDANDPPAYLTRPIREAHARGLKILIKPHLGYWGSPFRWRGDITFDRPEQWERFWSSYQAWILQIVQACRDADAFVIGTELDKTLDQPQRWRDLIARVRQQTGAPLTYAANWTDYRRVEFWDALDVIGIQAYFPVSDVPAPTQEDLDVGWRRIMESVSQYARSHNRRVVFTEIGYNRSFDAASHPWEYRVDGPEAEPLQAACLRSALRAIDTEPAVAGAFLWKWFPRPHPAGRNFQLATRAMSEVIRDCWKSGAPQWMPR